MMKWKIVKLLKKKMHVHSCMDAAYCKIQYDRDGEREREQACHRTVVRCLSFKSDYLGWTIKSFTWACVYKLDGWNTLAHIPYIHAVHTHMNFIHIEVPSDIVFHSCTSMWGTIQYKLNAIKYLHESTFFLLIRRSHSHSESERGREREKGTEEERLFLIIRNILSVIWLICRHFSTMNRQP